MNAIIIEDEYLAAAELERLPVAYSYTVPTPVR